MTTNADMLPELQNNPFTRVLGPPPSLAKRMELLDLRAEHSETERKLPHDQRKYALLRLFEVSVPIARQVELIERINMAIRQGYKVRDPARGWHRKQFLASSAALEKMMRTPRVARPGDRSVHREWTRDDPVGVAVEDAVPHLPSLRGAGAHGFALVGLPGLGKSTVTEITLDAIEQVVVPETPYNLKQLVHLKIDCPPTPTRRQFCKAAFRSIDDALGTDYGTLLAHSKTNSEELVVRLAHSRKLLIAGTPPRRVTFAALERHAFGGAWLFKRTGLLPLSYRAAQALAEDDYAFLVRRLSYWSDRLGAVPSWQVCRAAGLRLERWPEATAMLDQDVADRRRQAA